MLRRETHKGLWHYGKSHVVKRGEQTRPAPRPREEWLTVEVPALVDAATWDRAQAQLDRSKTYATRNAKRDYLLRGLIFCPSCGRRWTGRCKRETGRANYTCQTTQSEAWRRDRTTHFGLEQTRLEAAILAAVKAFLLDPETRAAGISAERERLASERWCEGSQRAYRIDALSCRCLACA